MQPDRNLLRLVDPATVESVPTLGEALEQKAEAEKELVRLCDEIERLKRLTGLN